MGKYLSTRKGQLIALLAVVVITAGVVGLLWATNVFGWRVWRLQEVQAFIGATLPDEAADIQFTTRTPYSRIVWLRFSLPASADVQAFVEAIGSTTLRGGYSPFPAPNPQEAAITWWQPNTSTAYSGTYLNTGNKIIEVLADRSDNSKTLIYLRAYTLGHG